MQLGKVGHGEVFILIVKFADILVPRYCLIKSFFSVEVYQPNLNTIPLFSPEIFCRTCHHQQRE